jgi:7,8-dihydro-6-hydroxymethylpterin-pyrophosphokinase
VLVPLTEIAPQLRHPLLHKTIAELLMDIELLTGQEEIERVSWL